MAFCNNCGHELIDGVKFCSNCGASVDNGMVPKTSLQTEAKNRNLQSNEYDRNTISDTKKPEKKKTGRLFAFLLFILASFVLIMDASLINTLLAVGVIVIGVYFFKKGYKFKVFTVLAMLMAVISILAWTSGLSNKKTDDDLYAYQTGETEQSSSSSSKNTQTSTSVTKNETMKETKTETEPVKEEKKEASSEAVETKSVVEEKTESAQESEPVKEEEQVEAETEEKQPETNNGVDPDLKAFLDSYEKFVDEYVDFMKKYQSDPGNAIAMMDDYTRILKQYADFTDKINKYDTKTMSKADLEYYLDVTNRCSKKMLSAAY